MPDDREEIIRKMARACKPIAVLEDLPDAAEQEKYVLSVARSIFEDQGELPRSVVFRATFPVTKLLAMETRITEELAPHAGEMLRALAKGFQATQLYQLTEMWMATTDKPDEGPPPSQRPDRKEAIMVICEDPTRGPPLRTHYALITRDEQGKGTLGDWQLFTHGEGRLTYLLPPEAYQAVGREMPKA